MPQAIIHADKRYRSKVLVICIVLILLGGLLTGWVLPWAKEYLYRSDPETALSVIKAALVMVFLSIVPFGLYLLAFGRKVMEHERFPPLGAKVIRDTKLVEGKNARVRGRVLVVLSLILIAFGVFGALYIPYMLHKLANPWGVGL